MAAAFISLAAIACDNSPPATPTPFPTPLPYVTPTLTPDARRKAEVSALFTSQVEAIKREDWAAVYATCSPRFRAERNLDQFTRDITAQLQQSGYTPEGLEARNVEPFVRAPDRVRVRWDAYQDGQYVRTEEIGEIYIFTQGHWFDDGAWCR